MKMRCPQCGVEGSANEALAGKRVRCPKCDDVFIYNVSPQQHDTGTFQGNGRGFREAYVPPLQKEKTWGTEAGKSPDSVLSAKIDDVVEKDQFAPESLTLHDGNPVSGSLEEESEAADVEEVVLEGKGDGFEIDGELDLGEDKAEADEKPEEDWEDEEAVIEAVEAQLLPDDTSCGEQSGPVAGNVFSGEVSEDADRAVDNDEIPGKGFALQGDSGGKAGGKVGKRGGKQADRQDNAKDRSLEDLSERFTVSGVLKKGWGLVRGAKLPVFLATLVMILLCTAYVIGISLLQEMMMPGVSRVAMMWINWFAIIGLSFLTSVFVGGMMFLGLQHVKKREISWTMLFRGFPKLVRLFIVFVLMTIMVVSGTVLFILPGIYLMVGYCMTLPLIISGDVQPWAAMEKSRRAVHRVWWKVFTIFLLMPLILFIAALPLGIGLFWALPFYMVVTGVIYISLFCEEKVV